MSERWVISVRRVRRGAFISEPGKARFLKVPEGSLPSPGQAMPRSQWVREVMRRASRGVNPQTNRPVGDILVFIHGYNNSQQTVMERHDKLDALLRDAGFQGMVVSFDWPSAASVLNYLEDRDDAKQTAHFLRDDCISLFSSRQSAGCEINVHLLGHSTGAYVIRQAMTDADEKTSIKTRAWKVSQIAMIGADISARSMSQHDARSRSLYRHCVRLTNYQNPFDAVLKLSNTKRLGVSPRLGRVGLPPDASPKAVDVDCGPYYESRYGTQNGIVDVMSHSWYFDDAFFARDLALTLAGDIDRHAIPTRMHADGRLVLNPG